MHGSKILKLAAFAVFVAIIFVAVVYAYTVLQKPTPVNYVDGFGRGGKGDITPVPTIANPQLSVGDLATKTQPSVLNLKIPFTSQAPTGNWNTVHNEDCEEAAAVMASAYLNGNTNATLPAEQVDTEMNTLNNWEDAHLGYHLDTTAQETAQMIEGVYGLQTKLVENYSLQDIKGQINLGHVIILSMNGQKLGNPNYKSPGPIHHMLVVRGYTESGLVTNDSGTRRGENYPYTFEVLYNAAADWNHSMQTVDQLKKVMIEVWK